MTASLIAFAPTSATAAPGEELVIDGTFEEGATGWILPGYDGVEWRPTGGNPDGRVEIVDFEGEIYQSVDVKPGVTYNVTFDTRVELLALLRLESGDVIEEHEYNFDPDWKRYAVTITIPDNQDTLNVILSGYPGTSWDNVSVHEV